MWPFAALTERAGGRLRKISLKWRAAACRAPQQSCCLLLHTRPNRHCLRARVLPQPRSGRMPPNLLLPPPFTTELQAPCQPHRLYDSRLSGGDSVCRVGSAVGECSLTRAGEGVFLAGSHVQITTTRPLTFTSAPPNPQYSQPVQAMPLSSPPPLFAHVSGWLGGIPDCLH